MKNNYDVYLEKTMNHLRQVKASTLVLFVPGLILLMHALSVVFSGGYGAAGINALALLGVLIIVAAAHNQYCVTSSKISGKRICGYWILVCVIASVTSSLFNEWASVNPYDTALALLVAGYWIMPGSEIEENIL